MADKIIPPRRGEILTGKGIGTTRFMEYLERATVVNEQADTDDTENTIAASPAAVAALGKATFDRRYALLVG